MIWEVATETGVCKEHEFELMLDPRSVRRAVDWPAWTIDVLDDALVRTVAD